MKPRKKLTRTTEGRAPLAVLVTSSVLEHARDVVAYAQRHKRADACQSLRDLAELGLEHAIAHAERQLTNGKRVPRRREDLRTGRRASGDA